jgi:hypothetical protein
MNIIYKKGNEGIANIAKKLAAVAMTNVRVLEVNFNSIGTIGAGLLADMLVENASLTHLNLSLNEIGTFPITLLEITIN